MDGSRSIGRSIALAFASAGASVSICARNAGTLEAARREIEAHGVTAHAGIVDLADADAIASYVPEAVRALGGLNVLVNNASGFGHSDDEAGWAASLSIDMVAVVQGSHAAIPHMQPGSDALASRLSTETCRTVEVAPADLTDKADLARIEAILREDASITMLDNNAGIGAIKPLLDTDVDKFSVCARTASTSSSSNTAATSCITRHWKATARNGSRANGRFSCTPIQLKKSVRSC